MVYYKFPTVEEFIEAMTAYPLDSPLAYPEDRRRYCKRVAERYADQFAYHFLKWFIEEEGLGINPTGTDIESYIHDFKESLK